MVKVIVEFRQPSEAGAASVSRMRTDAMRARTEALPSRIEQLRRDLVRLDAAARNGRRAMVTASSDEAPQVTHTYSRVLFGAALRVHRDMVPSIESLPYVARVRIARTFKPMLADSVAQIRANEVWTARGTRGKGIVVAVIDTGVDYTHPALGGGIGPGFKVIGGYDFANDDSDPKDDNGHGTHVAGIVAANGGEALSGVAPEASILAYKVLGADGSGDETAVIAAVERSVDPDRNGDPSDHAHIVNMSLGGPADDDDPLVAAVERATEAGVTFVVASGNGGDYGNLPSPGYAASAITVGAVDSVDGIANFSSRGPNIDFSIKPEVVAPGVGILSTFLEGQTHSLNGTSMATPHVAGVAALIKSLHPDWTAAEIKSAIVGTAAALQTDVMEQGGGRVDAMHATASSTLSSPATIDFGQVGPSAVFKSRRQVTLRNITSQPQTLTAAVTGNREGIAVQVTPNVVTLTPGQSQLVTFDLEFSNALVPAPQQGSLSFGGFVTWSGGAAPFHLPWSTVKAAFLTIDVVNNMIPVYAEIMGDRRKVISPDFAKRTRTLWRHEPVDIVLFEDRRLAGDYPVHVAFAESVDVSGAGANVTIDMNEAKYTFDTADALGPDGKPLTSGRWCIDDAIMVFPGGKKFGFGQASVFNGVDRHVLWSRLSPRVKVYTSTTCSDAEEKAVYVATYDPFNGLQSDVRTTLSQSWATPQPIRFVPEAADSPGLTIAYGRLVFQAGGNEDEYYAAGADGHFLRPIGPDLKLHFTNAPDSAARILTMFERHGRCESGAECNLVDNVWIYPDAQGSIVDSDLYLSSSPMAYRARPDRELIIGDTPVFPTIGFGGGIGLWVAGVSWRGAHGERRAQDSARSRVVAYDAAGAVIGEGNGAIVKSETLQPGRYRLEATSPDFLVSGRTSRGVVTVNVDTSKPDGIAPRLTAVRVEDEQRVQTTTVRRHSRPTLLFSAADEYPDAPYIRRRTPREDATRVEYRVHGSSEWHPLPALVAARQYQNNSFLYAGVGTMYRVDLSAVASSVSGSIDLRLHIEDDSGNETGYTLSPAFVVEGDAPEGTARRRAIRH